MPKKKETPFHLDDNELLSTFSIVREHMKQALAGPSLIPLVKKMEAELVKRGILTLEADKKGKKKT